MIRFKFLIIFFIYSSGTLTSTAQNYAELKDINLSDSASCMAAQTQVMECCDFLYTSPAVETGKSLRATKFIVRWMESNKNFVFGSEEKFYNVIKEDYNITARYYAALVKTAIDSNYSISNRELQLKAITNCLEYCEQPTNKAKITKKLRKYLEAKNTNTLNELIVANQ